LLKIADEWLKIPVNGQIASLNVAVATGVIVYEIIRQRMVAQN
jgi:23S rRNA (guanosine2251-2'-O)-methyltransferase